MNVFHSGTDWDDLYESAENESHYLSLVVNNKGQFDCKLAWYGDRNVTSKGVFTYKGTDGNPVKFEKEENFNEKCIFWVDCDIKLDVEEIFAERTNLIIKKSAEKFENKSITYPSYTNHVSSKVTEHVSSFNKFKQEGFHNVNSVVYINKNLVQFMINWLHPTQNDSMSLQEILGAINVQYMDSTPEDGEVLLECLVEELEMVADEFFGKSFTNYKLLAEKVKSEIEAYTMDFPELCFDLSESLKEYLTDKVIENEPA